MSRLSRRGCVLSLRVFLAALIGWLDRQQREALAYLIEENRILRGQLRGRRLRLSDDERRRLAVRGHRLGRRALRQIATIVTCLSGALVCVFIRFDLLTLLCTIFTYSLWWQNYRLLILREPIGTTGEWMVFAAWGAIVAAFAAAAFRSPLRAAYQRIAAPFE